MPLHSDRSVGMIRESEGFSCFRLPINHDHISAEATLFAMAESTRLETTEVDDASPLPLPRDDGIILATQCRQQSVGCGYETLLSRWRGYIARIMSVMVERRTGCYSERA